MATVSFGGADTIDVGQSLQEIRQALLRVVDALAEDEKQLEWAVNGNLDVKNIRAQSISADRMDVQQLSAIAADLGKITAGEIYGTYIATAEGIFPRAEMSNTNNLFTAYLDSDSYIQMDSDRLGTPTLVFQEGAINTLVAQIAGVGFSIIPTSGNMFINAQSGSLVLSGNAVRINSLFSAPLDSISQSNSSATTVAGLVADFNTLLGNLRAMNILA
ncbi:hypothetical protein [Paenibacillus oryzisoli]|uniref:Uncharacterized protein n=1 Tax=Paenibacillus oryzisoli TaxID=1850517 RepID=A0A198ACL8_9BACL|nr:hypothetical protein [Paenibacillus oryzisoli]OAS19244.1 hypothetical protein A8708_26395 [Paenibacillus oryzisoli]